MLGLYSPAAASGAMNVARRFHEGELGICHCAREQHARTGLRDCDVQRHAGVVAAGRLRCDVMPEKSEAVELGENDGCQLAASYSGGAWVLLGLFASRRRRCHAQSRAEK